MTVTIFRNFLKVANQAELLKTIQSTAIQIRQPQKINRHGKFERQTNSTTKQIQKPYTFVIEFDNFQQSLSIYANKIISVLWYALNIPLCRLCTLHVSMKKMITCTNGLTNVHHELHKVRFVCISSCIRYILFNYRSVQYVHEIYGLE